MNDSTTVSRSGADQGAIASSTTGRALAEIIKPGRYMTTGLLAGGRALSPMVLPQDSFAWFGSPQPSMD